MVSRFKKDKRLTPSKFIAIGYIIVIIVGAVLLSLPISTRDGSWTNFLNSLFTSTTSTCVTGLVVFDTYTHWSLFGQIVILCLIQIGGVGFMTIISLTGLFLKKKFNIHERKIVMQSVGSFKMSEVFALIKKIVIATIIFETIGFIVYCIRFIPDMGFWNGMYYSIFHSISAFCNAGIDIMGKFGEYSSFTTYAGDYLVSLNTMFLIITGGLGFLVWSDIVNTKCKYKKMSLHSRIVLSITAILIIIPTFIFFFSERNYAMEGYRFSDAVICSLFQSVTTRTAGFNTINLNELSPTGSLLTMILMFIGGSPGSTAGGIKTTTFVVLMLSIPYSFKNITNITIGKKQLDKNILKQACALLVLYLSAVLIASLVILSVENLTLDQVLFETISAIGTVGLSKGVTPTLGIMSKIITILLMYIGRIGGLSVILFFKEKETEDLLQRPTEKILIG